MNEDNYFEGVLQLRNPTEALKKYVKSEVKKAKNEWIARIKPQKNGVDYFISHQRFLRALGRKLQKRFNGQLVSTRRLFTQNKMTMKRVYRVFIMFRLHTFKVGQVLKYKGSDVKIKRIGDKIHCVYLDTGKKVMIDFKDLN